MKWIKRLKEKRRWNKIKRLEIELAKARSKREHMRTIANWCGKLSKVEDLEMRRLSVIIAECKKKIELLKFESVIEGGFYATKDSKQHEHGTEERKQDRDTRQS